MPLYNWGMSEEVWLLNPPSSRKVIRDYYCSKVSKGAYLYEPVDLLAFSAALDGFPLRVTDAVAQGLDAGQTINKAPGQGGVVLGLIGACNAKEDIQFYRRLKAEKGSRIFLSGDMAQDPGGEGLKDLDFAEGFLLDFGDREGIRALSGGNPEACESAALRLPGGEIRPALKDRAKGHGRSIGVPRHELFPLHLYRYPFVKKRPFATLLTDFGCAYACTFCIMSSIGFSTRPMEEVEAELSKLKQLGISDLYLSDQTFGANPGHTRAMLELLKRYKMAWVCFTRADLLAKSNLAREMAESGCHTIMIGVETIHEDTQKRVKKFAEIEKVEEGIRLAKEARLKVLGTFLVGLPGETVEDAKATLNWALGSGLDYASVNLAVPRNRTSLADGSGGHDQDQGGFGSGLVDEELLRFYNQFALKFYSKPRVALGLMREMASVDRMKVLAPEGLGLLKRSLERAVSRPQK